MKNCCLSRHAIIKPNSLFKRTDGSPGAFRCFEVGLKGGVPLDTLMCHVAGQLSFLEEDILMRIVALGGRTVIKTRQATSRSIHWGCCGA